MLNSHPLRFCWLAVKLASSFLPPFLSFQKLWDYLLAFDLQTIALKDTVGFCFKCLSCINFVQSKCCTCSDEQLHHSNSLAHHAVTQWKQRRSFIGSFKSDSHLASKQARNHYIKTKKVKTMFWLFSTLIIDIKLNQL